MLIDEKNTTFYAYSSAPPPLSWGGRNRMNSATFMHYANLTLGYIWIVLTGEMATHR